MLVTEVCAGWKKTLHVLLYQMAALFLYNFVLIFLYVYLYRFVLFVLHCKILHFVDRASCNHSW